MNRYLYVVSLAFNGLGIKRAVDDLELGLHP